MATSRPVLVVLSPITPALTGNGLAMRIATLLTAAGTHHDIHLIVVPVSGRLPGPIPDIPGVVRIHEVAVTEVGDKSAIVELVQDPLWRTRLLALQPIPFEVAVALPTLSREVEVLMAGAAVRGVVACRLAMAPLGVAVAERFGQPLLIDADDADPALFDVDGEEAAIGAWDRVGEVCLPLAKLVTTASQADAESLRARYQLAGKIVAIPNSVDVRSPVECGSPPANRRVLFVGNLTYWPNQEGLAWFVDHVLPLLGDDVGVDVVGSYPPDLFISLDARVRLLGWVSDLVPHYAGADVVIVPLRVGSGTRIKVLEAFSFRRPVVTTTAGVAGIDARDGVEIRVADDPKGFAGAIVDLFDGRIAQSIVEQAERLLKASYSHASVREIAAPLFLALTEEEQR